MPFCANCGAQIDDNASFCSSCGKSSATPVTTSEIAAGAAASAPASGGLADNVAGTLAYITIIPAILFLLIAPYNRSRFVRFHAFQSIFFGVAWFVLYWVASLALTPLMGFVCLFKAYQGQMFKLPIIGDLAEKQANAVSR